MRVCLWNLSQGRSELMDSLSTESVGFCQCSLLETGEKTCLLAFAGQQTEEVRTHDIELRDHLLNMYRLIAVELLR